MKVPDLSAIKLVGFDVDGVLTDGRIIIDDEGRESKNFHSRDGLGLKMLIASGIDVVIITGRVSQVVEHRAKDLGITELYQKVADKWPVFEALLERRGLAPHEAAFCGDDIIDLPILTRVGLAMAPADASPEVKVVAHFVSQANGGRGAARQMVEFLLKGQGRWEEVIARYTK